MTEISAQFKEIWSQLQERIRIESPLPFVYDNFEDIDNLYSKLVEKLFKGKYTYYDLIEDKECLQSLRESARKGEESAYCYFPLLEDRLMQYSFIVPNEKYRAAIFEVGILISPKNEEKNVHFLHEGIHLLYLERFPELPIMTNYPPAFVPNESVRCLFASYYYHLHEAMTYLTTIRLSDIVGMKRKEAWKFFYDIMSKLGRRSAQVIKYMVMLLDNEKHDFLDPLKILKKHGPSTIRAYLKEFGFKVYNEQSLARKLVSDLTFMRNNFDIELFRMYPDGSIEKLERKSKEF